MKNFVAFCVLIVTALTSNAQTTRTFPNWVSTVNTYPTFSTRDAVGAHYCSLNYANTIPADWAMRSKNIWSWNFKCQRTSDGGYPSNNEFIAQKLCSAAGAVPDPATGLCPGETNNCPAAGTPAGYENVTTGWSNGPSYTSAIVRKIVPDGGAGTKGSIRQNVNGCIIANTGGGPKACYTGQTPSSTGLYRISCDLPMEYTGGKTEYGDPGTDSGKDEAPPTCPGNFGFVNGKPTCLESTGAAPNNTQPRPNQGNPAPGSSPPDATGTGTSTGGDGTSQTNPGTSGRTGVPATEENVGTGTGTGGTGGDGTTENTGPKECGTPGKPKCQIDETATPDGKSDFKDANDKMDANKAAIENGTGTAVADAGKDTTLNWLPQIPTGSCQDPPIPGPFNGSGAVLEICKHIGPVTRGFDLLWLAFYGFAVMSLLASASSKGHA